FRTRRPGFCLSRRLRINCVKRVALSRLLQTRMDTSVTLLERLCKRWDQQAWGRFVQLYSPLIFSWGRRCGLQPADAADLTQDVFLTLFQKLPEFTYDRHKSFRAWLRTVTLNHWRDRQRRISTRPLPGDDRQLAELPAVDEGSVLAGDDYRQQLVQRAL